MQGGSSVCIEYRIDDARNHSVDFSCRPVSVRDKHFGLRQVASIRSTTDEMFTLDGTDPLEREQRLAYLLSVRATAD